MIRDILPEPIIELFEEYVSKIIDTVNSFHRGIELLNDMRIGEAREKLAETMKTESEADKIRKKILLLLEESRLDPSFKEDFFHLIKRIDRIADWVKEAARDLTIIPYLETPADIRDGIHLLIEKVVSMTRLLGVAVEKILDEEYKDAKEILKKIETIEEEADEIDVSNRGKLLKYSDNIKPITLAILLHDLNSDLEDAADACEEAADYLRALIVTWTNKY